MRLGKERVGIIEDKLLLKLFSVDEASVKRFRITQRFCAVHVDVLWTW